MYFKNEKIVYIEYQDGIPHSAVTGSVNQGITHWDFMMFDGEDGYLVYYESGGGPFGLMAGSHYCEDYKGGTFWADKSVKFSSQPINIRRIRNPHRLYRCGGKSTRNPFLAGEQTYSYEYCDQCGYYTSDYCREHIYEDCAGNLRYKHNNEIVE